jgi:hypothetical protein
VTLTAPLSHKGTRGDLADAFAGGRRGQGPARLTRDNATHAGARDSTARWLVRHVVSGRDWVGARTSMDGEVPRIARARRALAQEHGVTTRRHRS